jgi:hypothetical protein
MTGTAGARASANYIGPVLAGAWRSNPPPLKISSHELDEVASLLLGSSAGALAWWTLRNSNLKSTPVGSELQDAYRFHSVRALVRQHEIKNVLTILYSNGIEPILVKGWAVARLYPEPGLRPYGDIDLVVQPEQYSSALPRTRGLRGEYGVDLHNGFDELDNAPFAELYERSSVVKLDDVDVRVLSPEDHLRVLCLHLLRHNAFRPLWLCDIAVAVECRAADFNWDRCLTGDHRRADWIACCLGLAHQLLGANIDDTPGVRRARNLPSWLIPSVLKQWETPYSMSQAPVTHQAPMSKYLRDPRGLFADLRRRWPSPIEATVYVGGPFNDLPRWPFQVGECIGRTAKFLARLPKALRHDR